MQCPLTWLLGPLSNTLSLPLPTTQLKTTNPAFMFVSNSLLSHQLLYGFNAPSCPARYFISNVILEMKLVLLRKLEPRIPANNKKALQSAR